MAEAIGIASGLVTLVTLSLKSSVTLYQRISGLQNSPKTIRDLKEELKTLGCVLTALKNHLSQDLLVAPDLQIPLKNCAETCDGFRFHLEKLTKRSNDQKTSIRDWLNIQYRGETVSTFKDTLATYRSTITIALGHANLRTAKVTAAALEDYKQLVTDTTVDLKAQLAKIDEKLNTIAIYSHPISNSVLHERERLEADRESTEQCLNLCMKAAAEIAKHSPNVTDRAATNAQAMTVSALPSVDVVTEGMTSNMFRTRQNRFHTTSIDLQEQLKTITRRLESSDLKSTGTYLDHESMLREKQTIERCLDVYDEVSTQATQKQYNIFEDISSSSNGKQIMVSTVGDLISAKRISAGPRTPQWLGQMSDESLQQLSNNWKQAFGLDANHYAESDFSAAPSFSGE